MSSSTNDWYAHSSLFDPVADAAASVRAAFIRRTYLHLAGAVALFVVIEAMLLQTPLAEAMMRIIAGNRYGWLMILGGFMVASWLARSLAANMRSLPAQYAGLAFYVLAQAVLFVPLLYIAVHFSSPDVLPTAAILTGVLFVALTGVVFVTRSDFSFLRTTLMVGGLVALGAIAAGAIFGFTLGLWFSVAMVGLASAAILYDTSNILHHYSADQHVPAALELFASVALLFWYILQLMMRMSSRD
jgi:FtsH-binding integral membrane protein